MVKYGHYFDERVVGIAADIVCNVDVIAESQPNVCRTDDEVFMECMGCPPTCKNPKPQMCDLDCKPGCVCKEGKVRRLSDNMCVYERTCLAPGGR